MTYGTDSRPESYHVSVSTPAYIIGAAYEGQRVAQEHKSRGMIGQLIGEALYIGVDLVVGLAYFECLLIDFVWRAWASAPLQSVGPRWAVAGATAAKAVVGIRTDNGLGVFGARGAQTELA
jgi:hypothetical protein